MKHSTRDKMMSCLIALLICVLLATFVAWQIFRMSTCVRVNGSYLYCASIL